MIVFKDGYFYINTKNTSYIMKILPDGVLKHCYYGRLITNENMDFYNLYVSFDYTAPYIVENRVTTMDALPQECPGIQRGDYRNPAVVIENADGRSVNDFRYKSHKINKGGANLPGLPHLDMNTDAAETLEIVLEDLISGVNICLVYAVFEDIDIIARHTKITNVTDKAVKIISVMSANIDFESCDFDMISLHGRWANERTPQRQPLFYGKTIISSNRGASGHHTCPFVALLKSNASEEQGEVYGLSLIYSGNFEMGVEVGQFGATRFFTGINHENFSWKLLPNERFVSPQAVLTYSYEGIEKMSQNFHNMCRKHLGVCAERKKHPIVLNLWEAFYFKVTEEKVIKAINAAQDFGIDTLVLDDGWFGDRNNEFTSVGDWFVNSNKFPNGLETIIKICKSRGFNFGLWFEPEVISPESELYRTHPDWCIFVDGVKPIQSRSELILDFSRQIVVDYVYERISLILKRYDISYVKWDMNRNITDMGSKSLPVDRQGEYSHRYILGVYSLIQRLRYEFPNVFFEGSAGGGGRFDFGVLYYMPQIWASDNTDAIGRLQIQYGTSMLFPPETISAHISDCPNHQTGRITPFNTRGDVAQFFSFGYELDPQKITEEVKELLIAQISKHRELETWIHESDFYRLKDPFGYDDCAWQLVSYDKKNSAVLYVSQLTSPKKIGKYLKLRGLDPGKTYNIKPLNINVSGDVLLYAGLPIKEQYNDFISMLFTIKEI